MNSKTSILVIADDPKFRATLIDLLTIKGYELIGASGSHDALTQIRSQAPAVAVVDLNVSDGFGIDIIREIKILSPKTECIALTGYPYESSANQLINLGVFVFFQKPCDMNKLIVTICRAAEKWEADEALRIRNRELEELNSRLKKVAQSASELSACLSLKQLAPAIMNNFYENINTQGGSLYLVCENHLTLIHALDPGHAPDRISLPLSSESVFFHAMKTKEPILISDIHQEKTFISSGWHGYNNGSLLVFPLLDENKEILGILSLHNKTITPFQQQDKEIAKVLVYLTSQKLRWVQVMEALAESESRFRTVFEAAVDCIFIKDHDFQYVAINPSMKNLLKSSHTQLDHTVDEHFFGEPQQYNSREADHLVLNGAIVEDQFTKYVNQEMQHFHIVKVPMHLPTGDIMGVCGIARDITEIKRTEQEKRALEEQLNQSHKMEAIGQLAGGVAHDFNNLLTGIIGSLTLAKMKANPEIQEQLHNAKTAADRASKLVKQLLEFSRKSPIQLETININILLDEIHLLVRQTIDRRIDILVEKDECLPSVSIDSTQISSILMNLCINARDAIEEIMHDPSFSTQRHDQFKITLKTRLVTISKNDFYLPNRPAGDYVVIEISDNGAGMDEDVKSHIFEPFFSTKKYGKGTGLGLASAYGLMKQHRGWIEFTSQIGIGTTFQLYLPATSEKIDTPKPEIEEEIRGGKETILLVDDEEIIRTINRSLLEYYGYTVLLAEDGKQALDIYIQERPRIDLIILDLSMPNISGQEVMEQLHSMALDTKVIISSGYSEEAYTRSLDRLGATCYLPKPYQPDELVRFVRQVLDQA